MSERWLTQRELAAIVARESGLPVDMVRACVPALFSAIRSELRAGEVISLTGIGSLQSVITPRKRFQSNLTGRIYDQPSRIDIRFRQYKSSKKL